MTQKKRKSGEWVAAGGSRSWRRKGEEKDFG